MNNHQPDSVSTIRRKITLEKKTSPRMIQSCAFTLNLVWLSASGCIGCSSNSSAAKPTGLNRLNHVVVIVMENWSFDSLYTEFSGANGLSNATAAPPQIDATGAPYPTLPQTESHLPQTLPNGPFPLDAYIPTDAQARCRSDSIEIANSGGRSLTRRSCGG